PPSSCGTSATAPRHRQREAERRSGARRPLSASFRSSVLSPGSVALRLGGDTVAGSRYDVGPLVGRLNRFALLVGRRLQVGLGADSLDLVGEVGEEVSDLVEAVAVGAGNLVDALFTPGAKAGVPVLGRVLGAEDGGDDGVGFLGVGDVD